MTIKLYEVGGAVRDSLLGVQSKDVDFAVEAPSFDAMLHHIEKDLGLKVFLSKPEFLTVRAGVPEGHKLRDRCKDADFVLCRKDGPTLDGRRPQYVEPGTIYDDLMRRDFTVNAMARNPFTGELIDPHGGSDDLKWRVLRFVGDPLTRIREDGLRVMRAYRFAVTKGLRIINATDEALRSDVAAEMLRCVSIERLREELEKMLAFSTPLTIDYLTIQMTLPVRQAIFRDGLRLSATLRA